MFRALPPLPFLCWDLLSGQFGNSATLGYSSQPLFPEMQCQSDGSDAGSD